MQLKYIYDGTAYTVNLTQPTNLLTLLRQENVPINAICNGNGTCGKCRVRCLGNAPEPTSNDRQALNKNELAKGWRLACSVEVNHDLEIECPPTNLKMDILTDFTKQTHSIEPLVQSHTIALNEADTDDQRDDWTRIKDALPVEAAEIDFSILPTLHDRLYSAFEKDNGKLQIDTYKNLVVAVHPVSEAKAPLGLAIDIGSTTVAAYLHDLTDGKLLEVAGITNPQRKFGADVISRISYTMDHPAGTLELQKEIVAAINKLIESICQPEDRGTIREIVITGNTVMIHFLLNLPTKNIASAPFVPVFLSPITLDAQDIGLKLNAKLTIMPGIASYVGADITAGIVACKLTEGERWSLLLDLGTNGEIVLGCKDECLACATAAGPAFEGATIRHGCSATSGAICNVNFSADPIYRTIDDKTPNGICGSGVLDIAAQLLLHGLIDETGRLLDSSEVQDQNLASRLRDINGYKELVLFGNLSDPQAITFTQKDIREIQLAKAAIRAGIEILLDEVKLNYDDIENLYIAGGFGNYLNITSVATIGLIPMELKDRTVTVGNSAGTGASHYLLSKEIRNKSQSIIPITQYIELSNRIDFMDAYMDAMLFDI